MPSQGGAVIDLCVSRVFGRGFQVTLGNHADRELLVRRRAPRDCHLSSYDGKVLAYRAYNGYGESGFDSGE